MLLTIALLSVLHTAPATDSLGGSWQIKGDVAGNPIVELCSFKQTGVVLSGSCTNAEGKSYDLTGQVVDGKITFKHGGNYQGEVLSIEYAATLTSATEMKGTINVKPYEAAGDFTAAPAPAPAKP
jgi:hypothetical protein